MGEGRLLLIQLSPLLEEASRLIGASILAQLLMASFGRIADTPEEKRRGVSANLLYGFGHFMALGPIW
jgi:hypothetical protein